jgi:glucuronosyltransferase
MGQVGPLQIDNKKHPPPKLNGQVAEIVDRAKHLVIFSLGTVSNTTNMPSQMLYSFLKAFAQFPDIDFLWRFEADVPEAENYTNIHLLKWLPQKELMSKYSFIKLCICLAHPKIRLLIAHGGYNSFLEASEAGIPIILMPLFADQFINAKRAQRFGTALTLDKLNLTPERVRRTIEQILMDKRFSTNARRLAAMLADKPTEDLSSMLNYGLKLATLKRDHFVLRAAQRLSFLQFYSVDILALVVVIVILLML